MLAHQAYFDALESLSTQSDAWKSIMAGLVVLRLVDDWLGHGVIAVTKNPANVQSVREAIDLIPERDPVQPILSNIVDIVTQSEQIALQTITTQMLDYGNILESTGQWRLSLDVFANMLNRALTEEDSLTAARTARRLGYVLTLLGQLDASDAAYAITHQIATHLYIPEIEMRSRMAHSYNFVLRGNFNEATRITDEVIVQARLLEMPDVYTDALANKMMVLIDQREYCTAVRFCQEALTHISVPAVKDRVAVNLGAALLGKGDLCAAKKLLLPLPSKLQEEGIRLRVLINLLEIAALERNKKEFVYYRDELRDKLVLPDLQTHYHLYLAKGYQGFSRPEAALEEREIALTIANEYELSGLRSLVLNETGDARRNDSLQH